jgi:chromosome segregation protein
MQKSLRCQGFFFDTMKPMQLSLKSIELSGFKSFGKKTELVFTSPISSIVGPNGSGKSNVAEGFRFVLGEQSMKSMRSKRGEDLIWGGSGTLSRANRASVKVVFDNSKRLLDIDFKEVVIERVVYRDGQNEYILNGSVVRLKDVIRLLAGANIGGSGYQIISQGEADRILNASPRERREMVEDALGLKLYQHKKAEAERKLEETANNMEKTGSLRRELAPHLNFLRHQVEKIEKAREQKDELAVKLSDYLAREHMWIAAEDARLGGDASAHEAELKQLNEKLREAGGKRGHSEKERLADLQQKVRELEGKIAEVRKRREEIARELGRAEGALQASNVTVEAIVAVPHVRQFVRDVDDSISEIERQDDIGKVRTLLGDVRSRIKAFVEGLSGTAPATNEEVRRDVERLNASLKQIEAEEAKLTTDIDMARAGISETREASFAAERESVEIESKMREVRSKLDMSNSSRVQLRDARQRFEEEVREGIALVGAAIHDWQKTELTGSIEDRGTQDKRRREIERLKIKIEESGIGNGDAIIKEFKQTKERDEFLARELIDLQKSEESLRDIIADLEKTIDARFTDGLKHINAALKDFFAKLFGGGEAKLQVEEPRRAGKRKQDLDEDEDEIMDDEEDLYAGLTVSVHLPRKKMHGLEVLSGGERALTSIALIFSMSQVNPPPFLILDETDAALDEANSKRYADMIKELGQKSQLIVITHNRATMAAAGELYGVTMGTDGVSKLLSVKFEEATRVAK